MLHSCGILLEGGTGKVTFAKVIFQVTPPIYTPWGLFLRATAVFSSGRQSDLSLLSGPCLTKESLVERGDRRNTFPHISAQVSVVIRQAALEGEQAPPASNRLALYFLMPLEIVVHVSQI